MGNDRLTFFPTIKSYSNAAFVELTPLWCICNGCIGNFSNNAYEFLSSKPEVHDSIRLCGNYAYEIVSECDIGYFPRSRHHRVSKNR